MYIVHRYQWRIQGVSEVSTEPPIGLHLVVRSTDDRLTGTPLSGYRAKKTAAMAHLNMLKQKIRSKSIDWAGSCYQNDRKWAWFQPKMGVASKILCALCAQKCNRIPLQQILDLPLDIDKICRSRSMIRILLYLFTGDIYTCSILCLVISFFHIAFCLSWPSQLAGQDLDWIMIDSAPRPIPADYNIYIQLVTVGQCTSVLDLLISFF